jgi:hypothetical protein
VSYYCGGSFNKTEFIVFIILSSTNNADQMLINVLYLQFMLQNCVNLIMAPNKSKQQLLIIKVKC